MQEDTNLRPSTNIQEAKALADLVEAAAEHTWQDQNLARLLLKKAKAEAIKTYKNDQQKLFKSRVARLWERHNHFLDVF